MCTAIRFKDKYFGRNMDISYSFKEKVVITPREYPIVFKQHTTLYKHYAMIGMASVVDEYPLYADVMNECGLCFAGLLFEGYAFYESKNDKDKIGLAPYELPLYLLGVCKNIGEVKEQLKDIQVLDIPFKESIPVANLHFMLSDTNSSIVIECTKDGMHVYDNMVDVLTNNPIFPYHVENLNNYMRCTPSVASNTFAKQLTLHSLGVGSGGFGIPGDSLSTSRFIRAAFHLHNASRVYDGLTQFFHVLDSVKMVHGCVLGEHKEYEYTHYTSCMDMHDIIYNYRRYNQMALTSLPLLEESCLGKQLIYEVA